MPKPIDDRPTFYYNNDKELEIRAGGAIFYKIINDDIQFLLIHSRGKYEDFGGRTDKIDKSINHTIAREVDEESNNIFKQKDILKRIKNLQPIFTRKSKYQIYIIPLIDTELQINVKDFGDREFHDDIPRTVEFISINKLLDKDFIKNNLCFRLKFSGFFKFVNELYSQYCKKDNIDIINTNESDDGIGEIVLKKKYKKL
jgi:hypothetical protein